MRISVIISTYGMERINDTHQAIQSVLDQLADGDELLVVIDENDELTANLEAKYGSQISIVVSKKKGLSNARNLGVKHAAGEIVAFIDDDAVAHPGWLDGIRNALSGGRSTMSGGGNIAGCTGPIFPDWPEGEQAWFPRELNWMVSCTYSDILDGQFVDTAFGTNMAFKRDVLIKLGGFNARLGAVQKWKKVKGNWVTSTGLVGEERQLCLDLRKAGYRIVHSEEVAIDHKVYPFRVVFKNLLNRAYWEGYSKGYIEKQNLKRKSGKKAKKKTEKDPALSTEKKYLARLFSDLNRPHNQCGPGDKMRMYGVTGTVLLAVALGYWRYWLGGK